tara:strand:+ start:297 stop:701 length:405 start_codon:yes stop_codon:yes gene_type:complete
MAKESPTIAVNLDDSGGTSRNISNDITNLDWAIPRGVQDVTGVDKSAVERLLLLADYSCTLNGVFNDAANMSHAVFKDAGSTTVARTHTLVMSGQTLTAQEVYVTDYPLSRAQSGELTFAVPLVLQNGTAPSWS